MQVLSEVRVLKGRPSELNALRKDVTQQLVAAVARGKELAIKIPFNDISDLGAYKIAVGLKPTPDELEYNRRAVARP